MAAIPMPPKLPNMNTETVTFHGGYGNKVLGCLTFGELVNNVEDTYFIPLAGRSREDYYKPTPPPTRLIPPPTRLISEGEYKFNLINWLFPKCEYCDKRHIRFLFKLHYEDIHICKRCCWVYDINSIEKYKIVDKIRSEVKKRINLSSYCNMQFEENESNDEKSEVCKC